MLDDEYFKKFYQRKTSAGVCLADLELQLQGDKEFSPFRSKSADIRLLAGQTGLLYTVSTNLSLAVALPYSSSNTACSNQVLFLTPLWISHWLWGGSISWFLRGNRAKVSHCNHAT